MSKRIVFIVNSIGGKGANVLQKSYIRQHLGNDDISVSVFPTTYKGHATDIARNAVADKVDTIVACGGDGTINEVATQLVCSETQLGIVPLGSGNGLATNLHIPNQLDQAIRLIGKGHSVRIDAGMMNDRYFFSNMGIGFDASVISKYEEGSERQLMGYLKATYSAFKSFTPPENIRITIDDTPSQIIHPFMIFVSNSNQLGYNFSVTPSASLQDGKLDVVLIDKMSKPKTLLLGLLLLIHQESTLREVHHHMASRIRIETDPEARIYVQCDGEVIRNFGAGFDIRVLPDVLNVIVPPQERGLAEKK